MNESYAGFSTPDALSSMAQVEHYNHAFVPRELYSNASTDDVDDDTGYTPVGGCTSRDLYFASFHWSIMTLTTIGYGDVKAENTIEMQFMIFAMLLGACFFAFCLGTCSTLIESLDSIALTFQGKLDTVNDFMDLCHLPHELRR